MLIKQKMMILEEELCFKLSQETKCIMRYIAIISSLILLTHACTPEKETGANTSKKAISTTTNLQNGKALFMEYCSQCHHHSMVIEMTAPKMYTSIQERDPEWIRYYIAKGSDGAREDNDSIAAELRKQGWALMPKFDYLTTQQVDDILHFVAVEGKKNQSTD